MFMLISGSWQTPCYDILRSRRVTAPDEEEGLDFADVSVGFNTPEEQIPWGENYTHEATGTLTPRVGA